MEKGTDFFRWPEKIPSGIPLFVGPFAFRTTVLDAPEVMPVSDHVMRFEAPPRGLFVPVSQKSAP
ncbi:hypothetical protein B9K05_07895 [Acetobacter syzygii]|uniref:Uncharacterized protein n=1 Tax=Acetobacter syzygii TaxID=146476 RepID=A0A270BLW2_9PROT|nr:hypothetical protein B9K05_07895 [Acetobacter syzygii]PAL26138.1 hypothetical protein B9K04_07390 [Acetobacter syzygii]